MNLKWPQRAVLSAAIALALAAVLQEMEKPRQERQWHGVVAGFVPYDFRMPTLERIRNAYWNPNTSRIFTPDFFGVGWGINFCAVLERLHIMVTEPLMEEDFLMPTDSIRGILSHRVLLSTSERVD